MLNPILQQQKKNQLRQNMVTDLKNQIQELINQNSCNPKVLEKIENLKGDLYYWQNETLQQ